MQKNRIVFSKENRAIYISHLDLMRSMQRALKRSGLCVNYTSGFNPHIYLMFPLPLPLGVSGKHEIMDTEFTSDISNEEIKQRLNEALPQDIRIITVSEPVLKHTEIAKAVYKVALSSEDIAQTKMIEDINAFFNSDKIEIEKTCKDHGRKVRKIVDLKPDTELLCAESSCENMIICTIRLTAGVQNTVNPVVLFEKFRNDFLCENAYVSIERTKILCADGKDFA